MDMSALKEILTVSGNPIVTSYSPKAEMKMGVKNLCKLSSWKQLSLIAWDWALIAGILCGFFVSPSIVVDMCLLVLLASRQHALLVWVHEGAHKSISKNVKFNDFVSNFFCAYPILFHTESYRAHHMVHHSKLNSSDDPDWVRKIPFKEWQFPMSRMNLIKLMGKEAFLGGKEWFLLIFRIMGFGTPKKNKKLIFEISMFWLCLGTVVVALKPILLLYWFTSLYFLFPVIQRVRSISEHFGLDYGHELKHSRNTLAPFWEEFLFSPHNVNYHLTHHLFPTIPQYNLKQAHGFLMEDPEYKTNAHLNESFLPVTNNSVWKNVVQSNS